MNATRSRRTIAAIVAFAAIAAAPLGQMAATAEEPGPANSSNASLINPAAKARLTIHKYEGAAIPGAASNGTQIDSQTLIGKKTVDNVEFKITKVKGVDLTTYEGWRKAKEYRGDLRTVKGALSTDSGDIKTGTTENGGVLKFENLAVGLYYVEEVSAPAGYTKAAPFLVTLPMTNPTDLNQWMYDVHAYPKNTKDEVEKTVKDAGSMTADTTGASETASSVTYTIKTSIGDGMDFSTMGMYSVYDHLDSRVSFQGIQVALSENPVNLERDTDYRVHINNEIVMESEQEETVKSPKMAGAHIRVNFTEDGIKKLVQHSSNDVMVTIKAKVLKTDAEALGTTDGKITNKASLIPNKAWYEQQPGTNPDSPPEDPTDPKTPPTEPGLPTGEVESRYGAIQIKKVDSEETNRTLDGAQFTLYKGTKSRDASTPRCTTEDVKAENKIAGPITTVSGLATFSGLQLSNFYDGKMQEELQTYCLLETKAPEGYNLNAEPIAFYVTQAGKYTEVNANTQQHQVPNQKTSITNSLPLTGGAGVGMLGVLGLVLGAGGVGYYVVSSRRDNEAEADA